MPIWKVKKAQIAVQEDSETVVRSVYDLRRNSKDLIVVREWILFPPRLQQDIDFDYSLLSPPDDQIDMHTVHNQSIKLQDECLSDSR